MRASPHSMPSLLAELVVADEQASTLPLEHVEVNGQIVGLLASIALTQRFANPFSGPIELMYRFPIPHRASLAGFAIQIGGRTIEGEVDRREDAETLFREAVDAGQRAALATEERPNLYTVCIGNVQPGEAIVATYRYSLLLELDGGLLELALPFGITPRYHRADESPEQAAATDVVIAPPGAPVADLDVTLTIDAGVAIQDPESPSHQIEVTRLDERRCVVKLIAPRVPNKDFVLRHRVVNAGGEVLSGGWRTTFKGGDLIYAVFVPPAPDESSAATTPREYMFVLDRSGSMSGYPIAQARNALRACLRTLTPDDTFRILLFDNDLQWYEPGLKNALPLTDQTLRVADAFLAEVEGRGGTELLPALRAVIERPRDPTRPRVIVLLTDGAISAEEQVARTIAELPPGDRLFCFGIGPSVNRYLLDRLARAGRGVSEVVGLDEDIEGTIIRFQDRLSFPVLSNLRLDVTSASVKLVYPSPLPDLYAGQALHVVAQIESDRDGVGPSLEVHGRRGDTDVTVRIDRPKPVDEPLIRRLWGQRQIDALMESRLVHEGHEAVIDLSREYHILTPYTAFIAVDRETARTDQKPRKIVVAAPLPEGLSFSGFVAHAARGLASPVLQRSAMAQGWFPSETVREQRLSASPLKPDAAPTQLGAYDYQIGPRALSPDVPVVDECLRGLIRTQHADGAWGAGRGDVEWTAVAIIAFARAGHTPSRGSFRRPLRKALMWLRAHAGTPLERQYLFWAQGEVAAAEGNREGIQQALTGVASLPAVDQKDLVDAIAARLGSLLTGTEVSVSSELEDADPRVAIILAQPDEAQLADGLSPPWLACGIST